MNLTKNAQGHEKITLFNWENEKEHEYFSRRIEIILEPERFTMFVCTAGDVIKQKYGDFDLEEWLFVKLEDGPALIALCCNDSGIDPPRGDYTPYMVLDTLSRIYEGQDDAFEQLRDLMKNNKFPHEFQFYA